MAPKGKTERMLPQVEDLSGTIIADRYEIRSRLGEGAMGVVYLAEDMDLHRLVAVKVLRENLANSPALERRLEIECTLLAQLGSHPNVVMLLDRQVSAGKTMLVMEFVEGENLSEVLLRTFNSDGNVSKKYMGKRTGTELMLTPRNAILVAVQCLRALEHAHGKGVLHRDIKPGNIMVHCDIRGNIIAKLMDFGIAKTLKVSAFESAYTALTHTNEMNPGTPAYMAPEQIEPGRFGEIGPPTDIYSFGVMLFQMLTGRLPFTGEFTEVMHGHANVRPPSPREIDPNINPKLAQVVLKALQKSSGNRYQSAHEMLLDLQEAVGLPPDSSRKSSEVAFDEAQVRTGEKRRILPSRRFILTLILLSVMGLAAWKGSQVEWFKRQPASTETKVDGMTREQASHLLKTLRSAADTPLVHQYARGEWEAAEQVSLRAEQAAGVAEAIRLYTEAGRLFLLASGLSIERERVEKEAGEAADPAQTVGAESDEGGLPEKIEPKQTQQVDLGNGTVLELIWIPAGSFTMGSAGGAPKSRQSLPEYMAADEMPAREVQLLQGFWMGKYEITQRQWIQIMGSNPSRFTANLDHPVEHVSWNDCQLFLQRLNQWIPEGNFRLPTEAEWEYACRAGTRTLFSFGDDFVLLDEYAWYGNNSAATTHPVGLKHPNPWGLYDMHGNVSEWVQDWYGADYYANGAVINPYGPATGVFRCIRGGSWSYFKYRNRSAIRAYNLPDFKSDVYGLRVVRLQ